MEPIRTYAVRIPYSRRATRGYLLILGLSAVALLGIIVLPGGARTVRRGYAAGARLYSRFAQR